VTIKSGRKISALEKYGRDLTELARRARIDPVIGRDNEIRRGHAGVVAADKNNPVLIGDPGVGKTAIDGRSGAADHQWRRADSLKTNESSPWTLAPWSRARSFAANSKDRLKAFLKEVTDAQDQFILFIDELHTIVGAGAAEGSRRRLKHAQPMLARGELAHDPVRPRSMISQIYSRRNAALERRFQPVLVSEPSVEDTIAILRGTKGTYESHHGVAHYRWSASCRGGPVAPLYHRSLFSG